MNLLLKHTLLLLSLSYLSSASISLNCKKQDRKLVNQSTKKAIVVMNCSIDQYKLAKNGYQIPTYLRCKNGVGDYYLYMLVPDHATSTKTEPLSKGTVANPIQDNQPVQIPEIKPKDLDDESLPDSSAVKPK